LNGKIKVDFRPGATLVEYRNLESGIHFHFIKWNNIPQPKNEGKGARSEHPQALLIQSGQLHVFPIVAIQCVRL
jgi:hypothetical protein